MSHALIPVAIAGLPGAVGRALVSAVLASPDVELVPVGFTSSSHAGRVHEQEGARVELVDASGFASERLPAHSVVIDFSVPDAVVPNVERYCRERVPFVLGTSGDRVADAAAHVLQSETSAVIAANMAIPVILLQAAVAHLAARFPGAMAGGGLAVVESHQAAKRDISGTARAMLGDLALLGLPATVDAIEAIRDEARARERGVPEAHLGGHAYHDLLLEDPSGDATLTFGTRVHGRAVYAAGALAATRFLVRRLRGGSRGEVFSMIDVLEGQAS